MVTIVDYPGYQSISPEFFATTIRYIRGLKHRGSSSEGGGLRSSKWLANTSFEQELYNRLVPPDAVPNLHLNSGTSFKQELHNRLVSPPAAAHDSGAQPSLIFISVIISITPNTSSSAFIQRL